MLEDDLDQHADWESSHQQRLVALGLTTFERAQSVVEQVRRGERRVSVIARPDCLIRPIPPARGLERPLLERPADD
jgi:hypothetical protein